MEQERAASNSDGSIRGECGQGESTSTSSCVTEVQEVHEDAQLLRLLDAMDHLLSCRDSLTKSLSQGWMEIASARYSMGPSRIDQALFSLKPCPASTLVSVSRMDDFGTDEGHIEDGDQMCTPQEELQFALQCSHKDNPGRKVAPGQESAKSDVLPQSNLRQRHFSGLANLQHTDNATRDGVVLLNDDMAQDVGKNSKGSDSLAWFGTLVSPHLRVAQSSFKEALETIVELATAQSTIRMAYQQIQESGDFG